MAIRAALGEPGAAAILDRLPFKSQNRYSAVRLRPPGEGQGELTLVRFLQPAPGGLATLNYALTSDKLRSLHLVTSVVPYDEQQTADARLRGLLERAVWSTPQG